MLLDNLFKIKNNFNDITNNKIITKPQKEIEINNYIINESIKIFQVYGAIQLDINPIIHVHNNKDKLRLLS